VDTAAVQRVATALFRDELLRLVVVAPGRAGKSLDRALRLP